MGTWAHERINARFAWWAISRHDHNTTDATAHAATPSKYARSVVPAKPTPLLATPSPRSSLFGPYAAACALISPVVQTRFHTSPCTSPCRRINSGQSVRFPLLFLNFSLHVFFWS
ncbi:hypothetical protein BT93_B2329 [Corymbia citriodora subsp. variegata]|nr:hypothetical protein BT93_B2329 [Corymbia citriodora subsp. variegata]